MRIKNLKIQLAYRVFLLLICLTAVVFAFVDNKEHIARVFLFYTNWSVFLATLSVILSLVSTVKQLKAGQNEGDNKIAPIIKFSANITIIATFIVGGIVLHQFADTTGHLFRHLFVPVFTVLDTVLFDARNRYRVSYPFMGVIFSLVYWFIIIVRFCIARGSTGIPEASWADYYPYGFTNIDNGHTLMGLIMMLFGILCGLILIGFIFWVIDKLHMENKKVVFDKSLDTANIKDIFTKKN